MPPLLTAILLAGIAAPAHSYELQLKNPEFHYFNAQGSHEVTTNIPLCKGDSYGWLIQLENPPSQLTWREEFRPSGERYEKVTNGIAARWNNSSWSGPSITTVQTVAPDDGWLSYIRPINPNMSPGFYRIDVYVGESVAHFRIELLSCG
ncbi:MAG: hypothetical protein F6K36_22705 [Symploca sp. SIO3C6]|nr:hypothetical protein [Symploca sp. SIO3C6]NET08392.1 hypothetical protein [Symploca sp. SIO2B6]NET47818.1 hypothetical protein [Merismopedia sp. SIO2A8]